MHFCVLLINVNMNAMSSEMPFRPAKKDGWFRHPRITAILQGERLKATSCTDLIFYYPHA